MEEAVTAVYYFGCIHEAGHYLFSRRQNGRIQPDYDVIHPWAHDGPHIDGVLPPGKRKRGDVVEAKPGLAALHYRAGWTAIVFWDRTVDSRGGSSSTFLAEGFFSYPELEKLAKEQWPELWQRFARGGDLPGTRAVQRERELNPIEVKHVETVSDGWGVTMSRAVGARTQQRLTAVNAREYSADDLRELGWSVAVHNDYRLDGDDWTFWLVTKNGEALKGEGLNDAAALNAIRRQLEQARTPLYSHQIVDFAAAAIQHGDETLGDWLMPAAEAYVNGKPIPTRPAPKDPTDA